MTQNHVCFVTLVQIRHYTNKIVHDKHLTYEIIWTDSSWSLCWILGLTFSGCDYLIILFDIRDVIKSLHCTTQKYFQNTTDHILRTRKPDTQRQRWSVPTWSDWPGGAAPPPSPVSRTRAPRWRARSAARASPCGCASLAAPSTAADTSRPTASCTRSVIPSYNVLISNFPVIPWFRRRTRVTLCAWRPASCLCTATSVTSSSSTTLRTAS